MSFERFLDLWINRYLVRGAAPLTDRERSSMDRQFAQCIQDHRSSSERWGFKNPRNMLLLPFLDEQFPEMKFIHVVRDGRDMALSSNQNQFRLHGNAFDDSLAMWGAINVQVAEYGKTMGERYLCIRFENLCKQSEATVAEIFAFIGVDADPSAAVPEINAPSSLGRWRDSAIPFPYIDALRYFGYSPSA